MIRAMSYAICLDTNYGRFIMNRHDRHQPLAILRTGAPHIEPEIRALLTIADILPDGALVVDAGANIGLISVPLAQRLQGKAGSVLAFEPQRLIYYMLAGNTALAGLENLTCLQMGLSDCASAANVPNLNPHVDQDFGMVTLTEDDGSGDLVQTIALDDLGLERLDLLKIDVEHMELPVLVGATETIKRHRPFIWIEVWPDNYAPIYDWMTQNGYSMRIVDELNFCAIPQERDYEFPLDLPEFDGVSNFLAAAAGLPVPASREDAAQ